ncbi:MAG: hypothetical protein ACYS9X_25430, partial [Planctomycetota bacterium]
MGEAKDVPPVETAEPGAWPGGLAAWRARLTGPTARKGGWAVADQALVSGTRFVTAVMLARYTDPAEFGAYVLAFARPVVAGPAFAQGTLSARKPSHHPCRQRRLAAARQGPRC